MLVSVLHWWQCLFTMLSVCLSYIFVNLFVLHWCQPYIDFNVCLTLMSVAVFHWYQSVCLTCMSVYYNDAEFYLTLKSLCLSNIKVSVYYIDVSFPYMDVSVLHWSQYIYLTLKSLCPSYMDVSVSGLHDDNVSVLYGW